MLFGLCDVQSIILDNQIAIIPHSLLGKIDINQLIRQTNGQLNC